MEFYRKHSRIIKVSGIMLFTTGVGWVIAQINKTYRTLNNVLDTSVIHFMEPMKHADYKGETDDNFVLINWIKSYDTYDPVTKKGWNSLKFAYARRLLNMTSSENSVVRRRAVKQLAKVTNLDNWHYSLLAHIADARTAVGLARTESVDSRFFLHPPFRYLTHDHQMIINTMKDFLVALNNKSRHSCMTYFINRAFVDQEAERFVDHDSASIELRKSIQKSASDILPLCLESLHHHSTVKDYAKDIVLFNGLPLLMEIHNRFYNNVDISITLCNILSNISLYPELLEDIYRSGWIGVLAQWVKEDDIRLSTTAARVLANLDTDDDFNAVYAHRVYVLHPMLRSEQNTNVDVVFVHGLLGGVFFTWRQRDKNETTVGFLGKKKDKETLTCDTNTKFMRSSDPAVQEYIEDLKMQQQQEWEQLGRDFEFVLNDVPTNTNEKATGPYTCSGNHQCVKQEVKDSSSYTVCWPKDWLSKDCKNLRIIGVNYDTNLSMWAPMCPAEHMKTTLEERSNEFMTKLLNAGVGQRPIVWVTHSMGGLLVKNILSKASESSSPELQQMCSNTKAIVFYSTPHVGSRLATLSQPTALVLWPSVEVQELREESPALLQIHNKFLNVARNNPMKIVSFVETKSTLVTAMKFNLLLVEPHSANPAIGEFFEIPQDHLGICKPANRQSFLYQKVLNLIKEIAQSTDAGR